MDESGSEILEQEKLLVENEGKCSHSVESDTLISLHSGMHSSGPPQCCGTRHVPHTAAPGGQSPGSATPEPAASSPPGPSCTTTPRPRPSPSPRVERRVLRSARKAKHLSTAGSLQRYSRNYIRMFVCLFVCLFDLACFFLPSLSSLIKTCIWSAVYNMLC